jgi:molybdenum cofactor biosynthesis enzyme
MITIEGLDRFDTEMHHQKIQVKFDFRVSGLKVKVKVTQYSKTGFQMMTHE